MGQAESRPEELDLAQIQELCILFMRECPSGALHLHEFKRIFGVPSSSVEESLYIETVFRSFDTNKVGRSEALPPPRAPPDNTLPVRPPGQHPGLPGVRGGAALDLTGKPRGQAQVVLQDVRQGRERQVGPAGGEETHPGERAPAGHCLVLLSSQILLLCCPSIHAQVGRALGEEWSISVIEHLWLLNSSAGQDLYLDH